MGNFHKGPTTSTQALVPLLVKIAPTAPWSDKHYASNRLPWLTTGHYGGGLPQAPAADPKMAIFAHFGLFLAILGHFWPIWGHSLAK